MTIKYNQSYYGNLAPGPLVDSPYSQDTIDGTPEPPPGTRFMITELTNLDMLTEDGMDLMITEN